MMAFVVSREGIPYDGMYRGDVVTCGYNFVPMNMRKTGKP